MWQFLTVVSLVAFGAQMQGQNTTNAATGVSMLFAQTATQPRPQSIDPGNVALRSEELTLKITEILNGQVPEQKLRETDRSLKKGYKQLQDKAEMTRETVSGDATSLDLHESEDEWRALSRSRSALREDLTSWNRSALASLDVLNAQEAIWKAALDATAGDLRIEHVHNIALDALADIRRAKKQIQAEIDRIVSLQEEAAKQSVLVTKMTAEIAEAQREFHERLLVRVADPVWSRNPISPDAARDLVHRSLSRNSEMLVEFVRLRRTLIAIATASFLLVVIYLYRIRSDNSSNRYVLSNQDTLPSSVLIAHPLAVALVLQMPFVLALARSASPGLLAILLLVSLVPVLRILAHDGPIRGRAVYLLAAFFAMSSCLDLIPLGSPVRRIVFVVFVMGAIGALVLMLKRRAFRTSNFGRGTQVARFAVTIGLISMLVALVASVLGYILLAQFLRQAILLSSYLAVLLTVWARVTTLVTLALVQSRFVKLASLRSVAFRTWAPRFAGTVALLAWLFGTLDLLLLRGPFTKFVDRIMEAHLPGRLSGISAGDLLSGLVVLILGLGLARVFRFFLYQDVLSHFRLDRGVPELISNLAYYFVLLLVFLASIKALGVDLSKLTIVTGAFGVGLGFGLQNIVNNFVSGLILEFERPIHTGDVIEAAGQLGEVVRIGIRSTAIRTSQGAEVIVPNASLISGNVINWTSTDSLADSRYRLVVPVLVQAGADAGKITRLLIETVSAHPQVLRQPPPSAHLKSSNPTSLLFEVSFSIAPGASPDCVRNQVAIAAAHATRKEEAAACGTAQI